MPTECERSVTSPTAAANVEMKEHLTTTDLNEDLSTTPTKAQLNIMEAAGGSSSSNSNSNNDMMSTSQTSTTSNGSNSCNGGRKSSITSPDPTAYVAKARVTRPTPPPPPYNPMQFVQIKPCNLYQTAQEQLKKAEEVKKIKEIRKEEPEDWQNNLDNWKSSRRKRVEHIIDRVVEVKKLELEEHDRTRRKSKTFSEMMEERGERSGGRGLNKLASLAVYAEDEANDLSDLGIGTSSASGKSSLSEDYDNNSVMSDNAAELDKAISNSTQHKPTTTESTTREYISSPGYETSSSTAPASSPDPCEYTYEGAIQDYKQRVSRAASGLTSVALNKLSSQQQQAGNSKESTPERPLNKDPAYPPRRGSKIEDRLIGFEVQSPSEECVEKNKVDVPKIDISKRKEIFESNETHINEPKSYHNHHQAGGSSATGAPRITLRDRFKVQETASSETLIEQPKKELKRLSGDITSIKERLQSLEHQQNLVNGANGATKATANKLVDIPVPPLKERLSSLQNAVTKEEVRKPPVVLVDQRQLEIMKSEEEKAQQTLKEVKRDVKTDLKKQEETGQPTVELEEIDRDDSGIHTADDVELEERVQADMLKKEQELKLNAAIEALAKEEKQLSEAANAVNQIEAEFEELTLGSVSLAPLASNSNASATPITNEHMEYSVSSTNPKQSISCSSPNNISDNNSSIDHSSGSGPLSSDSDTMVKGLDFKSSSNLRRKPTNEMVHAKNLLKIFKDTFQNDIELDGDEVHEEHETKNIAQEKVTPPSPPPQEKLKETSDLSLNIDTKLNENSVGKIDTPSSSAVSSPASPASNSPSTSVTTSKLPRSLTPLGRPPMSPQAIRANTKFMLATPPGSPSLARKSDSQFSINGRVEIFNSKTMASSASPSSNGSFVKPTTPTMTTKKIQLPYINASKNTQSNNIELPKQQQEQQMPQEFTTKQQHQHEQTTTTVIKPLSRTTMPLPQHQHKQNDEKVEAVKSMPSQQMVNEPQTKLDDQQPHNNDSFKQQQPEVVICAPPITIVNPDELPKPNTVKNLSSCFQQQATNTSNVKPIKPLPRSRIPHATPPASPVQTIRNIVETSAPTTPKQAGDEEKKLSIISSSSTSSSSTGCTVINNNKTLSIMSNTSSTSEDVAPTIVKTNAQVHQEEDKPKSLDASTNKRDNNQTSPVNENEHKPAKILDNTATQALVESMIRADTQIRTLILDTKTMGNKTSEIKPLSPLNIDNKPEESIKSPNIISSTKPLSPLRTDNKPVVAPKSPNIISSNKISAIKPLSPLKLDNKLEESTKCPLSESSKSPTTSSMCNLPFTAPLAALHSPTSELFKTTTPLVVSALYDKHQPTPQPPSNQRKPLAPLKPIEIATNPTIVIPAELPNLPDCPPNESSLYKIASAPHSPTTPSSISSEKNMDIDSALCNSLLTSLAGTSQVLQRQFTVEEDLCQKVDKDTLPFHEGSTGFKDISKSDIKRCDGLKPSTAPKLQVNIPPQRQHTVEEAVCQKLDIHTLPDGKQQPITGFKSVSPSDITKCDNFFSTGSAKPSSKSNSKPNSPIMQARAAHSKALIDTCEKIIAEERLANTQLKSSLPSSPVQTPIMQRKSKIPKPISSCCKATESLTEADVKASTPTSPTDENGVIARMHVVETQIKVTTTTPPASPKMAAKPEVLTPQTARKTRNNIFDFIKKNFGVGGHSHKEEEKSNQKTSTAPAETPSTSTADENKVLVLSVQELEDLEKVKYDEIRKFDNSQFYVATEEEEATPPPLPKTPAPVNIEITRKIITDEILEDGKTEKDLTKEIDDLLDDELNKLNYEIEELEKVGNKQ